MHTMWKGTISFGLVNIPVKLHSATENKDIKLRQLHKECKTPIKYERTCPNCDEEVKSEEIVKAYEYAENKFVVLDEEDLENLKKEQEDKAVEIVDFVKLEEIDPIYFEKSYFISPNEGGSKAYSLLRKALKDTGKIGIAKIIIRSKEQLAIVRIYENTLIMETIHYPDEVRDYQEVPNVPEEEDLGKKELDTAKNLIEQLTTEFEPENYKDEYRTALMELIEAKKNDEEVTTAKPQPTPDNVTDLMEALEKSLEKTKGKKGASKKKTQKKKATQKKTEDKEDTKKKTS
ncbi:non-homologous end joining protein Ku [Pontibacillus marinus]|uniref:Non-homologous end joining protein Ku n=1 Tax=Pontibacillus marinus BH030004 = DSM 16465 TaxID=1385511 RepID=A0A0A5G8D4_9BACI|nr:Ku protein [Pontibacillus marinus]KGX88319.1 DNA repair protein [Pontibacillus marinus BH030004 = DSM 16465]